MVRLTSGNTYMGVASLLMTWHLLTPINCQGLNSTSLLLNPPKSPAFCPATLWSHRIGDLLTPGGAQHWQYNCWPLSATLNPMTVDSCASITLMAQSRQPSLLLPLMVMMMHRFEFFLPLNNCPAQVARFADEDQMVGTCNHSVRLIELVGLA